MMTQNTTPKRYKRKTTDSTKTPTQVDTILSQLTTQLVATGECAGVEGVQSIIQSFSKRLIESCLQGEIQAHLNGEKPSPEVDAPEASSPQQAKRHHLQDR